MLKEGVQTFLGEKMFINGVKITLVICLTIVVTCILCISYSEYINRYSIVTTQDSSVYIFDKKSTVLNRCSEKGCDLIETKLPAKVSGGIVSESVTESRLFGDNKESSSMQEELTKTEAKKAIDDEKVNEKPLEKEKTEPKQEEAPKEKEEQK